MSDKESTSSASQTAPARASRRLDTGALIELVRARPCLWDRSAPHYRVRLEKERAWRDVHRALDRSYDTMTRAQRSDLGQVISRKWANIRDSYKKYLNGTHRGGAGAGAGGGRPYLYADRLTFLDATYDKDLRSRIYYEKKESEHEPDEQEWLNEVFVDMEPRETETPEPKRMRTDHHRDSLEVEESIVSVLVNLIEKEEDEDRAFFKSVMPTVKSLSESDKFFFRIRVMKLLDSFKRKGNQPLTKREASSRGSDTD